MNNKFIIYLIISFGLTIFPLLASAQYQSMFGANSTYWIGDLHTFPTLHKDSTWHEKDTLINSEIYKVVKRVAIPSNFIKFNQMIIYINEDTTSGKIWFCTPTNYTKQILIDYSLNMKDSFMVKNPSGIPYYVSVDTIFFINNRKYLQFNESVNGCQNLIFIEGVGLNQSLFYLESLNDIVSCPVICHHEDNILVYNTEDSIKYENCTFKLTSGIAEANLYRKDIKIYPNPNSGSFTISFADNLPRQIYVYDFLGNMVFTTSSTDSKTTLNLPNADKGIYFINVQSSDIQFNSKIIVN